MYRALSRFVGTLFLAGVLVGGGWWWWHARSEARIVAQLEEKNRQLEEQKEQLQQVVSRLGEGKRVADLIVTDRTVTGSDVQTTLMFVEYDRAGNPLDPKQFIIGGEVAHVEAKVIEFDRDFVVKDDPLKGHSIALFTRIFGENEPPASARRIDEPGKVPAFYRGSDPKLAAFEQRLWDSFWRLERDESMRQEMGVRVAVGKGVWGPFEPDTLYTITLTPDGNLSRSSEPIRGVYQQYIQALKQKLVTSAQE